MCDRIRWLQMGRESRKVVYISDHNQLEDVDRHWAQHIEDYPTRNKQYKAENKDGHAINFGGFDIKGSLGHPRIMEDVNESLHKMGLKDKNGPQDMEDDMISTHDDTEVSTFTTDQPSMEDQLLDVLNKNKANFPCEVLNLLKLAGIPPQGGRGGK